MMSLSVIIITKNAEAYIRQCLESVKWANEIIVIDSGSTDKTLLICQEYTQNTFEADWPGYGPQKNRALAKANSEWILSIDADEWLSPESTLEIQQQLQNPTADAYEMPRRNMYCGKFIKHGDVGKDIVLRLFKRGYGKLSDDKVHERTIITGTIGKLKQPLLHNSYRNLDELLSRLNTYTSLSANARYHQGKKASLTKAITHSIWAFLKAYVFRLGFLDGRMGFIVAVSSAESSYYRYAKLLLLNLEKQNAKN